MLRGFAAGVVAGLLAMLLLCLVILEPCPEIQSEEFLITAPTYTPTASPTPTIPPFKPDHPKFRRDGHRFIPYIRTTSTYNSEVPEILVKPVTITPPNGKPFKLDPSKDHAHQLAPWLVSEERAGPMVAYLQHICCRCGYVHHVLFLVTREGIVTDWWVDKQATRKEDRIRGFDFNPDPMDPSRRIP